MKVRIAVTPPSSAYGDDQFADYLTACESFGFDTIWLSDIPLGPLGDPLLHLTFASARTTKLKLGMNVVPLGRNPMWLAKQLAQLDRLSNGRLLLSLVPGLGAPQERAALGYATGDAVADHRGNSIDHVIDLLRRWWSGETVTSTFGPFQFDGVKVLPRPKQAPLELWLGGIGPAALDRVARLADGWLTASATPAEAAAGRQTIERRAAELGRVIDEDHYGISIPYARVSPDDAVMAALRKRRPDSDLREIVPVGSEDLTRLLRAHIDGGLTKFVVRSMGGSNDWREELKWLADAVLPLQT